MFKAIFFWWQRPHQRNIQQAELTYVVNECKPYYKEIIKVKRNDKILKKDWAC